jgi:hypothetical protein
MRVESGGGWTNALTCVGELMKSKNRTYSFALVLSGISEPDGFIEDALYEAGCDDALLSFRAGTAYLDFDREAPHLEQAILSAVRDIEHAADRLSVARVEPGDQVTASEIARRAGLTREYIRLLVEGKRGAGHFPAPHSGITGKTLVWSWSEVAPWLLEHGVIDDKDLVDAATVVRDINEALELRRDPPARTRRLKYLRELKVIRPCHD